MISREEAIRELAQYSYVSYKSDARYLNALGILNQVFDGIGSCGKCQHYDKRENIPDWNVCLLDCDYHESNWYCKGFERKEKDDE